ncbi:MAG: SDR family oxidoreductase [Verrucomicrobiota bacterium]|nr:SDR family oxidoreductase [Limisphaera sp.]MDW8382848.1 SDR family oxidoreductase [Verrucomicrobiota bacterium]
MTPPRASTENESPVAWITGAGGLIGHALVACAVRMSLPWKVRPLTRADVDLTDWPGVTKLYREERPALILHCAALSRTPVCEAHPELARLHNIEVTRHLVHLASDAYVIFFSTDLVFDGRKGHYREHEAVHPLSVYAETKVIAEEVVRQLPRHLILRTSLNLGRSPTGDRAFNEQLRRAWAAGHTTRLFVDEYRSPIAADETARLVWTLVLQQATGTLHLAGRDRLSRWDLGLLLASHWPDIDARMEPASQKEFEGPPRPPDTSLDCSRAEGLLGQPMPSFRTWLGSQSPNTL